MVAQGTLAVIRSNSRATPLVAVAIVFLLAFVMNLLMPSEYPLVIETSTLQIQNTSRDDLGTDHLATNATTSMNRSNVLIFHKTAPHPDRSSGRVIEDQLFCHAYAWQSGDTYGGACGAGNRTYEEQKRLLESIGLRDELPYACARDFRSDTSHRSRTLQRELYTKEGTRIFIPEYLEYLRSKVIYHKKDPEVFTLAVHVKRGKVTPCSPRRQGFSPYLPNSHYLRLIQRHTKPGARVVIFSEAGSAEPLDEFRSAGYEIYEGGSETEVWQTIVTADIVILSRSSFGMIPALVAKGKVIYTPFWHYPIRGWDVVRDPDILEELEKETAKLNATC